MEHNAVKVDLFLQLYNALDETKMAQKLIAGALNIMDVGIAVLNFLLTVVNTNVLDIMPFLFQVGIITVIINQVTKLAGCDQKYFHSMPLLCYPWIRHLLRFGRDNFALFLREQITIKR
jgi:hypothetical protein